MQVNNVTQTHRISVLDSVRRVGPGQNIAWWTKSDLFNRIFKLKKLWLIDIKIEGGKRRDFFSQFAQ